jgi:hypothetical protein
MNSTPTYSKNSPVLDSLRHRTRKKVIQRLEEDANNRLVYSHIHSYKPKPKETLWQSSKRYTHSFFTSIRNSSAFQLLRNLCLRMISSPKLLKSLWTKRVTLVRQIRKLEKKVIRLGTLSTTELIPKGVRLYLCSISRLDSVTADLLDHLQAHEKLNCSICGNPLGTFYDRSKPFTHWLCGLDED